MVQRIFNNPRTNVLRLNAQYPVPILQVYIPPYNTLQVIQVCANVVDMLPIAQIGFKNEDVHIYQLNKEYRLFSAGLAFSRLIGGRFRLFIVWRAPAATETSFKTFL